MLQCTQSQMRSLRSAETSDTCQYTSLCSICRVRVPCCLVHKSTRGFPALFYTLVNEHCILRASLSTEHSLIYNAFYAVLSRLPNTNIPGFVSRFPLAKTS